MPSGEQGERAKGHGKPSLQEWDHIRERHLSIRFDRDRDLIEISWACGCGDKSCTMPHTTVAFYSCPSNPCPPWSS